MQDLPSLLRSRRDEIVAIRPGDLAPALLERIVLQIEQPRPALEIPEHCSLERVVEELLALRQTIVEVCRADASTAATLNRAVDQLITASVHAFSQEAEAKHAQAVGMRDRILALVSHDLRNPLGAIDLGAALLLRNANVTADPTAKKQAETVQRATRRMERMISDLLDMSSIQAGRLSLQRAICPLEPILIEALDQHRPTARDRGIEIESQLELGGPAEVRVLCDHDRVLQVLSNLIGNAIKFCTEGDRITITIAITVRSREALICVRDTGPGIAGEALPNVFELYWQGGTNGARGTGLGLFIAKGIADAHGGSLWVESELGEGSAFFLSLPLAK